MIAPRVLLTHDHCTWGAEMNAQCMIAGMLSASVMAGAQLASPVFLSGGAHSCVS